MSNIYATVVQQMKNINKYQHIEKEQVLIKTMLILTDIFFC